MQRGTLNFVDWVWQSYSAITHRKDLLVGQVNNLFGTELYENDGGLEYCFVPTLSMKDLEERINKLYKSLKVADHEVMVCNEVFYTSKIEGATTTISRTQEIHDGLNIESIDSDFSESMVYGGFNATKYLNLVGDILTEDILLKTWEILVNNSCNNEDIHGDKYRIGNVFVGKHSGLNYQLLDEAMTNWIEFYNSDKLNEHKFIKAALLHFSFEFIHPFCDGNGRCGRLLMMNYLIRNGYENLKAVSISRSIEKDRLSYDYAFNISDNKYTDCTWFIEYMLRMFEDALIDVCGSDSEV